MNVVRLVIPGASAGKERPRVTRNGTYTPKKTKRAERDVRTIWREAGSPRLEGPLAAYVRIFVERPRVHFTSKGALSAEGRRTPFPMRTPDCDNAAKLLLDSLNNLAYRDDAQVVDLDVKRRWCDDINPTPVTILTVLVKVPVIEPTSSADINEDCFGEHPPLPDLREAA